MLIKRRAKISKGSAALFLITSLFLFFPFSGSAAIKNQAVEYREKGFQFQQAGDIDAAFTLYQKAVQLDPYYAAAYNDLGVIYEVKGILDLAEQGYRKAIDLDGNFLAAYSNLAALYEKKGKPLSALHYWRKRVENGLKGEEWTEKARKKLYELAEKSADVRTELKRMEAEDFNRQLEETKRKEFENKVVAARQHFKEGQKFFQQKEYLKAVNEFNAALGLTPDSREIIEARQNALRKLVTERVDEHYRMARKFLELGDYGSFRAEMKKALSLVPEVPGKKSK